MATVLAAMKEYDQAKTLARKAIEGGYTWPPCYTIIARANEKEGNLERAAEY